MNYQKMYEELKKWLYDEMGIQVPISIEPYTFLEYQKRCSLQEKFGDIFLEQRDKEAIIKEQKGEAPWLTQEL